MKRSSWLISILGLIWVLAQVGLAQNQAMCKENARLVWEEVFSNGKLELEETKTEGDRLEVRALFVGTHRGHLKGLAPSGRTVEVPFRVGYRLAGGKIAQHWLGLDALKLRLPLGGSN